jgi:cytochrome c
MRATLIIAGLALAVAAAPRTARAAPLAGDPENGHKIFQSICALCHSNQKDTVKIGPPLYGAFGRKPGSYPNFHYSDALKAYGQTVPAWDVTNLQVWEAGARKMIPGTKMSFPGLKDPKQRDDIIAYLQTLHD